jgi:hypothetical protein
MTTARFALPHSVSLWQALATTVLLLTAAAGSPARAAIVYFPINSRGFDLAIGLRWAADDRLVREYRPRRRHFQRRQHVRQRHEFRCRPEPARRRRCLPVLLSVKQQRRLVGSVRNDRVALGGRDGGSGDV